MKRIGPWLLLAGLGLAVWAGWSWRIATREAAAERAQTVRAGVLSLDLSRATAWSDTAFAPGRTGTYAIVLESVNPTGPLTEARFEGVADVEVLNPAGRPVFQVRMDERSVHHLVPSGVQSSALGDVTVAALNQGSWTVRARVLEGDPRFADVRSSIYLQTPSRFDVGWYLYGELAWAVMLGVGGVILIVTGAIVWRRSSPKKR